GPGRGRVRLARYRRGALAAGVPAMSPAGRHASAGPPALPLAAWPAPVAVAGGPAGRHPPQAGQPANAPAGMVAAAEVPAGSATKYEINDEGLVEVDRFLSMPVAYPANYGSIPRSLAGDGDPLDALVLTRQPLHPGTLVRFRPVAVLRMRDRGEEDAKIVG